MQAAHLHSPVRGLLLACHPLPCVAVTVFASAFAAVAGASSGRLVSIALAVLAGQLTVGWSNDAIDGRVDRLADRPDKPIAQGLVAQRTVTIAAALAGATCVVLSLRLGLVPALLHLAAVASALAYNAVLKSTVLSPLPYVFSFGLLPVVMTMAVDGAERPPVLLVVAAAMLGGAAHFGNTIGDAQADAVTGVTGLPQRLGPRRSQQAMAVIVAAGATVVLAEVLSGGDFGSVRSLAAIGILLAGVLVAAAGAMLHVGEGGGHAAWRLTLLSVALVVSGFLLTAA